MAEVTSIQDGEELSQDANAPSEVVVRAAVNLNGGEPPADPPVRVTTTNAQGQVITPTDLRVKIIVPKSYIRSSTAGLANELYNIQGIVFPYTPQITYDVKADYSPVNPTHGNYTQYFYQHSSIGPININGKITVQNDKDAGVYLAITHLLKALTKMKFGTDLDAGSPPPICRLSAYGQYMMRDIPIVISSYRIDLPPDVDYFTLGKNTVYAQYKQAMVPIVSTINITCYPMYSRNELSKFSVDNFLNAYAANSQYL